MLTLAQLQALHARRSSPLTLGPAPGGPVALRNQSPDAIVAPAQNRGTALAEFFGSKVAELGIGFGMGYMEGTGGEPQFMVDPAAPTTSGFGLTALLAGVTNIARVASLWTGVTLSKKIGGYGGAIADGAFGGAASTLSGIFWYRQGTIFGHAKETATKGVDYDAPALDAPHAVHHTAAPSEQAEAVRMDARVAAGRRAAAASPFAGMF